MFKKIHKMVDILTQPIMLKQLLSMYSSGYLKEIGWINSFKNKMPIDKNSDPLPWVTYGFIDFISDRLDTAMDVFEYGSGNSTLWYASKVHSLTSIEHDKNWLEKIKKKLPHNCILYYETLEYDGKYSKFSCQLNKKFDVIIVDGRDRVNCIKNAIDSLTVNGIIVLDDSERIQYKEAVDFLLSKNFKKIDFWGISPGLFYKKNTTIFYRDNNCLGI